ncbi:MAG: S8 family serine peptidase [Candidatus Njordarchaeales archaeon]
MRKKLYSLFLILLICLTTCSNTPLQQNTVNKAPKFKGKNVDVLIWLRIPLNIAEIIEIKKYYYSRIHEANSLATIDMLLDSMRKTIYEEIVTTTKPYIEKFVMDLSKKGIKVLDTVYILPLLHAIVPEDAIPWLQKQPLVLSVFKNFKVRIMLDVATKAINATTWWINGYNGSNFFNDNITGVEVAVLDTGIQMDHPYLRDRIIDAKSFVRDEQDPNDEHGHGTHVAGIIASTHGVYKGVAHGANIINAKCLDSRGEGVGADVIKALEWAVTGATDTAEIINMSFGSLGVPDGEDSFTRYIDAIADLYDVAIVVAAGNKDYENNVFTINLPGDGYNVITVGAVNDRNTVSRNDDIIADFSCEGPTNDSRVKPDVVAPGVDISSTYIGSTLFISWSGTSMATPMVAGAIALMAPYLIPRFGDEWVLAAKALLINSADDWAAPGPDGRAGWGYINLLNAWKQKAYVLTSAISQNSPVDFSVYAEENETVKITIVWNRRVLGESATGYIFYNVSRLKVQLLDSAEKVIRETNITRDNVRQLKFLVNKSGYYLIRVVADYIDPRLGSDVFAIASTSEIILGNIRVGLTLNAEAKKKEIYDSETLKLEASVTNISNSTISGIRLNVTTNDILESMNSTTIMVGDLAPNETVSLNLVLKPVDLGEGAVALLAYYPRDSYIIRSGQVTISGIKIIDDDPDSPLITILRVEKLTGVLPKIKVVAKVEDPSGVFYVALLFGVNREITEDDYNGKLFMKKTSEPNTYEIEMLLNPAWIGSKIAIRILAFDNDADRPNDSSFGISETIWVSVSVNDFIYLFGTIIVIIAILIVILIKGGKEKVQKI